MPKGLTINCRRCERVKPRAGSAVVQRIVICADCKAGPQRKYLKALDLYCGGGGAALGLLRAGFNEVVGIDLRDHSKVYPGTFIQGDALVPGVDLEDFDLVWASPPCQAFSWATNSASRPKHPNLIPETRSLLDGHPFTVIENVPQAPIRADLKLTGPMVGLPRIYRMRHFELSFPMLQPTIQRVQKKLWDSGRACTITTSMCSPSHYYPRKKAGLSGRLPVRVARRVMGITTPMTTRQVGEAVPPPYSEFIGREAIRQILMQGK